MRPHNRSHRIRKRRPLQNLRAHHRVDLHLLEFFLSQTARLGYNVPGHCQLSYIVQQRRRLEGLQFVPGQSQLLAHFDRINAHAP